MIKLEGSAAFSFTLSDSSHQNEISDFVSIENLSAFTLHESAGNRRPLITVTFKLTNPDIINYLGAGNILTVAFGINEPTTDFMEFELYSDDTDKMYELGYDVTIKGAYYLPKFTSNMGYDEFTKKTSVEVMQEIAKKHNKHLRTNISKTNDRQTWVREGCTEWIFMSDLWLHSYINDNTFMAYGFDSSSFYFYDMKEKLKQDPDWIFSNYGNIQKKGVVVPIAGYTTKNIHGYISDLVGKNLNIKTFNIDTGEVQDDSYKLKNFGAIESNKVNINAKNCLDYNYAVISTDVHKNYIKAYNQNLRNNLMYSSFIIYVPTAMTFKQCNILDTVAFGVYPEDPRLEGTAVITEIMYQYQFGKLLTNITVNKEAPSGLRGDDISTGD